MPGEVHGIPVTAIENEAFKGNQTLTSVHIGKNIKTIGTSAFENNTNLSDVYIDSTEISNRTDNDAHLLSASQTVYVEKNITVSNESYIAKNFPSKLPSSGNYILYGRVTGIEVTDFYEVNVGESVEVTIATVPAGGEEGVSFEIVGEKIIEVERTSSNKFLVKGFNSGNTEILFSIGSVTKSTKIRAKGLLYSDHSGASELSVKKIGTLTTETKLIIPDEVHGIPVTAIENEAFKGNQTLTSVHIGKNIKTIGTSAFESTSSSAGTITSLTFALGGLDDLSIGSSAFKYQKIVELRIPARTTSIGVNTFNVTSTGGTITKLDFEDSIDPVRPLIIGTASFQYQKIKELRIPARVTSIGANTFSASSGNGVLTKLDFEPNGEQALSIGTSAFKSHKVTNLIIPNRTTAIAASAFATTSNNGALTSLTFEANRTRDLRIEDKVFEYQKITSITIPETVTFIGTNAFYENKDLSEVYIDSPVIANLETNNSHLFTAVDKGVYVKKGITPTDKSYIIRAFSCIVESISGYNLYTAEKSLAYELVNDVYHVVGRGSITGSSIVVPETHNGLPVTAIRERAFSDDTSITSVTIGINVEDIGDFAFARESVSGTIASVTFVSGGTRPLSIGTSAFKYSIISDLCIPNRTILIGDNAFMGFSENETLTSLIFEGNGTRALTIKSYAFAYQNFTTVTIPNRVTGIGSYAFRGTYEREVLSTLEFEPNGIKPLTIDTGAFRFQKLQAVTIPSRTTVIDDFAFGGIGDNGTLTSLTFEPNRTRDLSIAKKVFEYQKLASVTIPEKVTSIGEEAFFENKNLTDVYIDSPTIANIETNDSHLFTAVGKGVYVKKGITPSERSYIVRLFPYAESINSNYNFYTGVESLEYEMIETAYHVVGRGSVVGSSISVPDTYKGLPVVAIQAKAFENDTNITSVTIGKNVTYIGNSAFAAGSDSGTITRLTFVARGTSDLTIGDDAFRNQRLTRLDIPSRTSSIGKYAFNTVEGSGTLTNFTFASDSLDNRPLTIGDYAFQFQKMLAVTIPNRVRSIGIFAFAGSKGNEVLRELTFEKDSIQDLEISNSAFRFHKLDSVTIPSRTTSIGNLVFDTANINQGTLTSLIFEPNPTGSLAVGKNSFRYQKLSQLVIASHIRSLGDDAFLDNTQLTDVYIDSSYIANLATNNSQLLTAVDGVYVKKDIEPSSSSYIKKTFSQVVPANNDYNMYKKTPLEDLTFEDATLAGARHHSLALVDGRLYGWGYSDYLGIPEVSGSVTKATLIAKDNLGNSLPKFKSLAAGEEHSLAVTEDGKLYSWGYLIGDRISGQARNGIPGYYIAVPTLVTTFKHGEITKPAPRIVAVAGSEHNSLALSEDGTVYSFGLAQDGMLGNGDNSYNTVSVPTRIEYFAQKNIKIKAIAMESHCLAIAQDNTLWAWGNNSSGQLGDETTTTRATPQQVYRDKNIPLSNVTAITAGYGYSAAISEGQLYTWGNAEYGMLGNGSVTGVVKKPTLVPGNSSLQKLAKGGECHTLALSSSNEVYSWGYNLYGQAGQAGGNVTRPTKVPSLSNIIAVAGGYQHSLARAADGKIYAWGDNSNGELGNGTISSSSSNPTPTEVLFEDPIFEDLTFEDATLAGGYQHSLALVDGRLYGWGDSEYLGIPEVSGSVRKATLIAKDNLGNSLPKFKSLAAGGNHSFAVTEDGKLYSWGSNNDGQLGLGTSADSLIKAPTLVTTFKHGEITKPAPRIVAVAGADNNSLALSEDGTVYSFGKATSGILGNGDNSNNSVTGPTRIEYFAQKNIKIKAIAMDSHCLAIAQDNTLWAWGNNSYGQLGDETTTTRATPQQVYRGKNTPLSNVTAITAGYGYSAAISEGQLYTWGSDNKGQLGNGSVTGVVKKPTLVSDYSFLQKLAKGGTYHTLALSSSNEVYTWGYNFHGQAGQAGGNVTSPTKVPSLSNIIAVAGGDYHSLARAADGKIYAWGRNSSGQLGNGTSSSSNPTPTEVLFK
ncbi:MAG: leucine-rich repeat protein [Treponemataceae bacterium]